MSKLESMRTAPANAEAELLDCNLREHHFVRDLISSTSSWLYGLPSRRKMSWNHTGGSSRSGRGSSQAKMVLVLPATRP